MWSNMDHVQDVHAALLNLFVSFSCSICLQAKGICHRLCTLNIRLALMHSLVGCCTEHEQDSCTARVFPRVIFWGGSWRLNSREAENMTSFITCFIAFSVTMSFLLLGGAAESEQIRVQLQQWCLQYRVLPFEHICVCLQLKKTKKTLFFLYYMVSLFGRHWGQFSSSIAGVQILILHYSLLLLVSPYSWSWK